MAEVISIVMFYVVTLYSFMDSFLIELWHFSVDDGGMFLQNITIYTQNYMAQPITRK
jgi:cyclopropane fatty-acyl-phospholipid synthase-like methyltransferase